MVGAPSPATPLQLEEVHIQIVPDDDEDAATDA
jgi:hypothetical protein